MPLYQNDAKKISWKVESSTGPHKLKYSFRWSEEIKPLIEKIEKSNTLFQGEIDAKGFKDLVFEWELFDDEKDVIVAESNKEIIKTLPLWDFTIEVYPHEKGVQISCSSKEELSYKFVSNGQKVVGDGGKLFIGSDRRGEKFSVICVATNLSGEYLSKTIETSSLPKIRSEQPFYKIFLKASEIDQEKGTEDIIISMLDAADELGLTQDQKNALNTTMIKFMARNKSTEDLLSRIVSWFQYQNIDFEDELVERLTKEQKIGLIEASVKKSYDKLNNSYQNKMDNLISDASKFGITMKDGVFSAPEEIPWDLEDVIGAKGRP